jgi:hypothetical protein
MHAIRGNCVASGERPLKPVKILKTTGIALTMQELGVNSGNSVASAEPSHGAGKIVKKYVNCNENASNLGKRAPARLKQFKMHKKRKNGGRKGGRKDGWSDVTFWSTVQK